MDAKSSWSTKLVGRAADLELLEAELKRSLAGEFRCVLISGDPGLGKTRLATELLQKHSGQLNRLFARGFPLGQMSAFGVWAEAVDTHLRALSPEMARDVCGEALPGLAGLVPSAARLTAGSGNSPSPPGTTGRALVDFLDNLSSQKPTAVLLDDMHLSDASSWEVLLHVARRLGRAPLLVVITARPAELDQHPEGAGTVARLDKDGVLVRVGLAALQRRDLEELATEFLGEVPPRSLVAWLADKSQGNPLFALGLLQALVDQGAPLSQPEIEGIPEPLVEQVKGRLRGLPQEALSTLEALAVLGRPVEIAALQQVTARSLEELAPALDVLVESRLVEESHLGRMPGYGISHPLIRDAIYQQIKSGRRLVLHRAAALTLVSLGRPAEASSHFLLSGAAGDDHAIRSMQQALINASTRRAAKEALTILAGLVDVLPAGDKRWLDVHRAMSTDRSWWLIDPLIETRPDMAAVALREIASALSTTEDVPGLAEVNFELTHVLAWGTGRLWEAEQRCAQAVELFESSGNLDKLLSARVMLAFIRGFQGDLQALARESASVAERAAGLPAVRLQALWGKGLAACWMGDFDEATGTLREGIDLARESSQCRPLLYYVIGLLACSLGLEGKSTEAVLLLEEARRVNPEYAKTVLPDWTSWVLWMAGDYRGALESSLRSSGRHLSEMSCRRGLGVGSAALAAIELDRLSDAEICLERMRALYHDRRFFFYSDLRYWAEGLLGWRQEDPGSVDLLIRTACRVEEMCAPYGALVHLDAVEAALDFDRPDEIAGPVSRLEHIARRTGRPFHAALAELGAAWSSLAAGAPQRGADQARKATRLLEDSGAHAFSARAFGLMGRCLAEAGRDEAIPALETAISGFERCGAVWRVRRTVGELKAAGARGERAALRARGPGALTRREREVARLAGQGNSAGTIAELLFISDRTVEWHLANAYAKLGVENRRDLTRRMEQLGL